MGQGPAPVLRILCVDDNRLVGEALQRRLAVEPTLEWLGQVTDGRAVEETVRGLRPDIVLMDVDMPDVDTFDIVERMSIGEPAIRILMFSGHVDVGYINRALDSGAWGYLSKNDDVASLIECIRRAADGDVVLSAEAEAVHRRSRDAGPGHPA
ncbi:MAG: response regulator transcription factor [Phycisphaerales bacterium]|nr:response regulator transcription factor [Phycisphaerales bacterium]